MGGLAFDATGSYAPAFLIVAAAALANVPLVALIKRELREYRLT